MRTGLLAKKLGMTSIFVEEGNSIPVTLLKVEGNTVVSVKTSEKNGYDAVQVSFGERKASRTGKTLKGFYSKKKIAPKQNLREFRVASENLLKEGDVIAPSHFVVGQKVDISGKTIGRGFQGVMKRHNFAGLEATHGVSISHRSHGSTGQCQDPGRTFKGKKMAGQMGDKRITKQSLEVVVVDEAQGIIGVKGSTQGYAGSILEIKDAVKAKLPEDLPTPAKLVEAPKSGGSEASNEGSDNSAPADSSDKQQQEQQQQASV